MVLGSAIMPGAQQRRDRVLLLETFRLRRDWSNGLGFRSKAWIDVLIVSIAPTRVHTSPWLSPVAFRGAASWRKLRRWAMSVLAG